LITNSTMRHCIHGADSRFNGRTPAKWVSVVTLDGALGNLAKYEGRRIILKIDAEGFEPNIIAGAKSLLESGRVAMIVWECGDAFAAGHRRATMVQMVGFLSECGFRHSRPVENDIEGPFIEFGNVFSFGPQLNDDGLAR
jgi:Methyltransferase FkbM domain